ncbi:MAG TPA: hypothetical protein VGA73_04805 [Candidatus Binatia bacterium]
MHIESYRWGDDESIIGGGEAATMPYPRISAEDWEVWKFFLPVRSHKFDRLGALKLAETYSPILHVGIPYEVAKEVEKAGSRFEKFEVWRAHEIEKDPIAVGLIGNERYLIARWGMAKLIPFDALKKRRALAAAWKHAASWAALAGAVAALATWGFLF